MCPAAWMVLVIIFCTTGPISAEKLTYHVQSSLKMRTLRVKILQRFLILNQNSMQTTTWMLSSNPNSTHSHQPISWNLVYEASFDMLQSSSWWMESSCAGCPRLSQGGHTKREVLFPHLQAHRQSVIGPFFPPSHTLGAFLVAHVRWRCQVVHLDVPSLSDLADSSPSLAAN